MVPASAKVNIIISFRSTPMIFTVRKATDDAKVVVKNDDALLVVVVVSSRSITTTTTSPFTVSNFSFVVIVSLAVGAMQRRMETLGIIERTPGVSFQSVDEKHK